MKTEELILISISEDGNAPSQIVKIREKMSQTLFGVEGLRAKTHGSVGGWVGGALRRGSSIGLLRENP